MKKLASHVEPLDLHRSTASDAEVARLLGASHPDPHSILGAHEAKLDGHNAIVIRSFNADARAARIILDGIDQPIDMREVHPHFFEGGFKVGGHNGSPLLPLKYRLQFVAPSGEYWETEDPYAFTPFLGDMDQHLFNEGNHHRVYDFMGAHLRERDGVHGVGFCVWAPNAERVSVVGHFNNWDGRRHMMRRMGLSGIWELFIPRLPEGTLYKFEIRARNGDVFLKTDPYGYAFEMRPGNAALVASLAHHEWRDEAWMKKRKTGLDAPMAIYELHLGSWIRDGKTKDGFLNYRELAEKIAAYVLDMGYTHIELLPVMEHPYDGSWGYQVTGYYAPTSRFGTPTDFMYFVDYMHQKGIGVIVDWVPAHFPRDVWALGRFDGTAVYEHEDSRLGEHKDWGTYIFNFGRHEVKNFLVANALFWLDKYHIDGLRVDAVASMIYRDYSRKDGEWLPNQYGGRENLEAIEFLKYTNTVVHQYHQGAITVAEESTSWPMVSRPTYVGGLGFDYKWNMGWMNDFLEYVKKDPIHRRYHQGQLTFAMMYAYSENFVLVLSHDEVVHGKASLLSKMPGDEWQKFANLRVSLGYMMALPGKKLLFQGADIGQWQEWYEGESVHWHLLQYERHDKLHSFMRDLLHLYQREPAMHQVDYSWSGFNWIDCHDADNSILSWIRRAKNEDDFLICVFNFTPVVHEGYRIGVPREGRYREVLNSDGAVYGGSNVGNAGEVWAEEIASHGHPHSLALRIPPLGGIILKPDPKTWKPREIVNKKTDGDAKV
jgi:1,4-alpha-glucan branching enzyme